MRPQAKRDYEQFAPLCQQNRDLRFERTADGDLLIIPPTMGDGGIKGAELTRQVANWANLDGTGRGFGASGGFKLPNGAIRSPRTSWVRRDRLACLGPAE